MKRFLIGFAAMALVMTVSASDAKAERGRRRRSSQVTYVVPATYVVPTYVVPTYVVPTYVVPTYVAPVTVAPTYVVPIYPAAAYVAPVVSTTYTIHSTRSRGR